MTDYSDYTVYTFRTPGDDFTILIGPRASDPILLVLEGGGVAHTGLQAAGVDSAWDFLRHSLENEEGVEIDEIDEIMSRCKVSEMTVDQWLDL